jgi:hypothetical protein
MDRVVGETTYVKAAEDMGDSIMPSMWPRNMQALLGTDRRIKRLDPQPTGINWLGTTTTSTTSAATGSVFLKEHTFVDLNHLQVLLKPASSEEESDQILPPQQQHSSNQQVALRELYSDKQAKSLSLLQKKLRVLNIQRQEAERELLLDDQALLYEPTTVYKTDSALQNHQIRSKTERKQQVFQESRYSNEEEEEEGTPAGSWNSSSESGAQQQLQPVEEDDHDKQAGQQDWRERARALSKLLSESTKREAVLSEKLEALSSLQKRITTTATSPPPPPPPPSSWLQQQPHLEHKQLRQQQERDNMRRCCDSYLRFALRTAPIVVGHQVGTKFPTPVAHQLGRYLPYHPFCGWSSIRCQIYNCD